MEGKDGTREMTAVGKQMEMEVREELWRKCAMPAACTAVSCKTISAGGTWQNFLRLGLRRERRKSTYLWASSYKWRRTIGRSVGRSFGQAGAAGGRAPIAVFQFHTISGPVSTPSSPLPPLSSVVLRLPECWRKREWHGKPSQRKFEIGILISYSVSLPTSRTTSPPLRGGVGEVRNYGKVWKEQRGRTNERT